MDIINKKVISVGRTRGVQRGTIVGYAYEFQDEFYSIYTDLLIVGEDGMAFSWKGDSGKLIVTDNELHQPIALLWGGWQERLREGKEQEIWTYAIDLAKVLDRLKLELIK
jgi:CubicO group peptidase (beta-lactamase class C family)